MKLESDAIVLMTQQKRTVNEVNVQIDALSRQIGLLEVTFIEKIEEVIRKLEHRELKSGDIDDMIRVYANNALPEFEAGFRRYLMDVRNDSIKQKYAGEFTYVRNNLSKRLTDEKGHDNHEPYDFENIGNDPLSRRIFYGGAGVGKTIFFMYLEKELLRAILLRTDSLKLPVYIFIPHLSVKSLREILKDTFRRFMQNANSVEKLDNIIDKMIYDNRLLFLFDSFDQTNNRSSTAFEELLGLKPSLPGNCSYYISTRQNSLDKLKTLLKLEQFPMTIRIEPFTTEDGGQLKAYLKSSYEKTAELIERYPKLEHVVRIPLFAKMIKELHLEDHKNVENIKTKSDIYRRLLNKFWKIEKDEKDTHRNRQVDYYTMESLVEEMSLYLLTCGYQQEFDGELVKRYVCEQYRDSSQKYLDTLKDIQFFEFCKGIFDAEHEDFRDSREIRYHHLNFQEYLAGRYLALQYRKVGGFDAVRKSLIGNFSISSGKFKVC